MANTYHQIYLQTVFAAKYHNAVIDRSWRSMLCGVIGNLINETMAHGGEIKVESKEGVGSTFIISIPVTF